MKDKLIRILAFLAVNTTIYGLVSIMFGTLNPLHWNMLSSIFVWVALCISSVLFWD